MKSPHRFQQQLFEDITEQIDGEVPLSEQVAEALRITRHAAYRRIRGQTTLSLDEGMALMREFGLSLPEIQGDSGQWVAFRKGRFIKTLDDYTAYMRQSLAQLQAILQQPDHVLYYQAKDVPIYYQFGFPTMTAFKIYVWLNSVYGIEQCGQKPLSMEEIPSELIDLARQQWEVFAEINSVEIWNDTTILSLLQQLEYFHAAGMLSSEEQASQICDEFLEMLEMISRQVESGHKVNAGGKQSYSGASYRLYYHEILLMDNHILAEANLGTLHYFIPYAGVNYLTTADRDLTTEMYDYLQNQTKRCSLINETSVKERKKFFARMRRRVEEARLRILEQQV